MFLGCSLRTPRCRPIIPRTEAKRENSITDSLGRPSWAPKLPTDCFTEQATYVVRFTAHVYGGWDVDPACTELGMRLDMKYRSTDRLIS